MCGGDALGHHAVVDVLAQHIQQHVHALLGDAQHRGGGGLHHLRPAGIIHFGNRRHERFRHFLDVMEEGIAKRVRERGQRARVEHGHGLFDQLWDQVGQSLSLAHLKHLAHALHNELRCFQRILVLALVALVSLLACILSLARREPLQEARDDVVDGALPHILEQGSEGSAGCRAHLGLAVAERIAHGRDEVLHVERDVRLARALHDLREAVAHALARGGGVRQQALLQDGHDRLQHRVAHLLDQIADGRAGRRLPLGAGRSQVADDLVHEDGEHLAQHARGVGHHSLPHAPRHLPHARHDVAAHQIDAGKQLVALVRAQQILHHQLLGQRHHARLAAGPPLGVILAIVQPVAHEESATGAGQPQQQRAQQLHRAEANAPAICHNTVLQCRQQELRLRAREFDHQGLPSFEGHIAHLADVVG